MGNYPHRMYVRMSSDDLARAKGLAISLDMSISELTRLLIQSAQRGLPMEPGAIIAIDRETAMGLKREMRRWGHHYNQAVHALNAIAYYLRLDEADSTEALEILGKVSQKIDTMNDAIILLREEVDEIADRQIAPF